MRCRKALKPRLLCLLTRCPEPMSEVTAEDRAARARCSLRLGPLAWDARPTAFWEAHFSSGERLSVSVSVSFGGSRRSGGLWPGEVAEIYGAPGAGMANSACATCPAQLVHPRNSVGCKNGPRPESVSALALLLLNTGKTQLGLCLAMHAASGGIAVHYLTNKAGSPSSWRTVQCPNCER